MPTPLPQNQLVAPSGTGAGLYTQGAMEQQQKYPGLNQDVAIGNTMMNETGFIPSVITSKTAADKTATNQATLEKIKIMQQQAIDSAAAQHKAAGTTPTTPATLTPATTTNGTTKAPDPLQAEIDAITASQIAEHESYRDIAQKSLATLPTELQSTIDSINASFERRQREMESINKSSLNTQTLLGIRSGRSRYAAELQEQLLTQEENAGKQRLIDLDIKKNELLAEARQANDKKMFELLDKKLASVDKISEEQIKLLQNQQKMAYDQETLLLQKAKEAREAAKDAFEMSQVDNFFKGSDIISLMKELPAGQTQELTDPSSGKTYSITGLQQEKDTPLKQIESVDDRGNLRIVNLDTKTGKVISVEEVGNVGKTKTGPTTVILNQQQQAGLETALDKLEKTKDQDGFYNIDTVIAELQTYASKNPGKLEQFLDIVKPKLNPQDAKARQLITGDLKNTSGAITITNPNTGTKFTIE